MSMDRRQMFKFVAGAAIGVAVPGTATQEPEEGTFAQMDDTPKEYFPTGEEPDFILTEADIGSLIEDDDTVKDLVVADDRRSFTVRLPPPTEGRLIYIKNPKTCDSLAVLGDGKLWHII
jgi:hypothetical protein